MPTKSVQLDFEPKASVQSSAIALGIWIGLGLFICRSALIFAMDHYAHDIGVYSSLWRLGRVMPVLFGVTLIVGLVASYLAALSTNSLRSTSLLSSSSKDTTPSGAARFALVVVGVSVLSALFVLVVSGFGIDQSERVPGVDTDDGRRAWLALCGAGIVSGILVLVIAKRRTVGLLGRLCARKFSALVPVVLMALAFVLVEVAQSQQVSLMKVQTIARALLEGEQTWEVLQSHPTEAPSVGVIVPVVDWRVGGGERPALIMPPGSEVRFQVSADDGAVVLRSEVGADQENITKLKRAWPPLIFGFEVEVNGAIAYEQELSLKAGMEPTENFWHPVGGDDGLALKAGDEVVLRTKIVGSDANARAMTHPWRIGFSKLMLERTWPAERSFSSPEKPNLILILQDTQRSDRLGCYGYDRETSPNVDKLAERGTLYEHAYATSSWTWPSTTSVLSGLLSPSHGVLTGSSCYLASGIDLAPEALQRGGYTTIAVSGSPLIVPAKNFGQGFETYYGNASSFRKSELLIPSTLDWIRMNAGTRFFMYLHLVDTHDPHLPNKESRERLVGEKPADFGEDAFIDYTWKLRKATLQDEHGNYDPRRVASEAHQKYLSDLYDACVATGDDWVGQVIDTVDELGLTGETVFVYTSDHGEEFFEHGKLEHSHSIFGELVRVPLILAGPNIPIGERSRVPISNRHIASTLAALGAVRIDGLDDGLNLAQPAQLPDKPVYFSTYLGWWENWYRTPLHGVRDGEWTLHFAPEAGELGAKEPTPDGESRLYGKSYEEVIEGRPVANDDRETQLKSDLRVKLKELEEARTTSTVESGDGTRSLLEGIGYIEGAEDE